MKLSNVIFFLLSIFVVCFSYDYYLSFFFIGALFFIVLFKSLISDVVLFNVYDFLILIYIGIAYYFYNVGSDDLLIFSRTAVYPWIIFFVFRSVELDQKKINYIFLFLAITLFIISSILMFTNSKTGTLNINFDYLFNIRTRRDFLYWGSDSLLGPTNVSTLVGMNIILSLYLLKVFKTKISTILYFMLAGSFFYILILSSRTTWIAIFVSLFIYIRYKNETSSFSKGFLRIFINLFILSIFVFLIPSFNIVGFEDLSQRFEFFTTLEDDNLSARFVRWIVAIELISDNYFGYGFSYYGVKTILQTPHNELLGQLVSVGIIGTSIIFYIYASVFNSIRKLKKTKMIEFKLYYMVFSFIIVTSLTEYYSYAMYNLFHPVVWMIFGLIKNNHIIYKEDNS